MQWAYELISQNKLYSANIEGFKLPEDRPEVKAWTNLISLKTIPTNKKECERLAAFQAQEDAAQKKKKNMRGLSEKDKAIARAKSLARQKEKDNQSAQAGNTNFTAPKPET